MRELYFCYWILGIITGLCFMALFWRYSDIHDLSGLYVDDVDDVDDDCLQDESGITNAMQHKLSVKPDKYGIIGTLRDSHDNQYYAVVVPKDEMDETIRQLNEETDN